MRRDYFTTYALRRNCLVLHTITQIKLQLKIVDQIKAIPLA